MKIIEKKTESLIPYEFNNKVHDEQQVNHIANSIKEFWFTQPIVIDKNNIVIIWHWRLEASKKLWLEKVPCYIIEDLNETQIKKLRILDNKLNESERDIWNLKLELDSLEDMNFWDLELDVSDLFKLWDDVDEYGENFTLPSWEKSKFWQITFTITEEQREEINNAIEQIKKTDIYKSMITYWNDNSNWNALTCIIEQWLAQNK